ncbi:MAG: hypothetical protein LBD38_01965 [Streptococcaceae bacterium]|jgi:uncharacterized protein YbcI|nr:hypothetical protein [Streptococcaceae bacterium]
MNNLPKNNGEFQSKISSFKEKYLGKNDLVNLPTSSTHESEEEYQKIAKKYGKRRLGKNAKREFCKMQNKLVEYHLEGKEKEERIMNEKFKFFRKEFMKKNRRDN